ncbi:sulfurtransferase [Gordonia sp. DT219]|uniref:sulfurtransferase n=1 Tax=Gordonia sp. DT219 TaxID=3416658 RepID=UPI003CFB2763
MPNLSTGEGHVADRVRSSCRRRLAAGRRSRHPNRRRKVLKLARIDDERARDQARRSATLVSPSEIDDLLGKIELVEVHNWRRDDCIVRDGESYAEAADRSGMGSLIPGASLTHVRHDFAGTVSDATGHLPLPRNGSFSPSLQRLITSAKPIVVYACDGADMPSAARAWLILRYLGVDAVRVLDGGFPAYRAATQESGRSQPSSALTTPLPRPKVISADEALHIGRVGTLLDARPEAAFRGNAQTAEGGHIPGARNAPASALIGTAGSLLPTVELRRWFLRHNAIGNHRKAAYCGGGVQSALVLMAAALVGLELPIYLDSWSGYIKDAGRPVQFGDVPQSASEGTLDASGCSD